MKYRIEVRKSVERSLKKLDVKHRKFLYMKLKELERDAKGSKGEAIAGVEGGYRKEAGPYRILYLIDDEHGVIDVCAITHWKETKE